MSGGVAPVPVIGEVSVRSVPIELSEGVPCSVYLEPFDCVTYAYQPVAPGADGGEVIVIVEIPPVVVIDCEPLGADSPLLVLYVTWTR